MLKTVFLSISFCLALSVSGQDLNEILTPAAAVFEKTADEFMKQNRCGFRWTSTQKSSARYAASSSRMEMKFLGFKVYEAIVYFADGKVSRVYLSIYNRGDAGALEVPAFEEKLSSFQAAMNRYLNEKSDSLKGRFGAGQTIRADVWVKDGFLYTLKWSVSGHLKKDRLPEYLQLEIEKFDPKNDPRRRSLSSADKSAMESKKELAENVKRDEKGNVWIDGVPMVDQGQKGYCAAAVAERVLRYYGCEGVTQHTIAQLCRTDSGYGTSYAEMVEALRKAGSRFGIRLKQRYSGDIENMRELEKMISSYNKIAKKMKYPRIRIIEKNNRVYLSQTMAQMQLPVYRKYRLDAEGRMFSQFKKDIRNQVDAGLPLVWCVMLGLIPDRSAPQARGGHMRLIIGYNTARDELIYSDSWGARHEFKTMPMEDAWTITTRTLFINPRPVR